MNCAAWRWAADGDNSERFESRFEAVEAAANEFGLTDEQTFELMADGWILMGQRGSVAVRDENDTDI